MPKKPVNRADITISGGGIAGLTLAALLGQEGLRVHVIDPAPPQPVSKTEISARTIALMQSSVNIIAASGAWEEIQHLANPLKAMRIVDVGSNAQSNSTFYAREIGQPQFGFNISNSILRAALYERIQKINTVTFHQTTLKAYNIVDNKIVGTLENGETVQSTLLAGADGRKSKVRSIAEIDCDIKDYNQVAITCIVSHTRSHDDTATEFHRPHGPLAFVPMPDNQSAVVWIELKDRASEIMKLRKQDFTRILQDESKDCLGTLTIASNPESWPLSTSRAKTLVAPRVALLAEAAHVMSPITAQGLNLSLRDVAALAETIIDAMRLGIDPGSDLNLKKYERRRATDIATRVFGVDRMNTIASTELNILKGIRRGGLNAVSAIRPLKKLAMRAGLAPEIDMGRLAKGLPL